jgi:hypothetical protein
MLCPLLKDVVRVYLPLVFGPPGNQQRSESRCHGQHDSPIHAVQRQIFGALPPELLLLLLDALDVPQLAPLDVVPGAMTG